MTDQNTLQESSSDKTILNETTDLQSESKSGSPEISQSPPNLSATQLQGVRRVLRFIERDRQEAEAANRNANFDRVKGITSGMTLAYQIAYTAIVAEHPQVLSGDPF